MRHFINAEIPPKRLAATRNASPSEIRRFQCGEAAPQHEITKHTKLNTNRIRPIFCIVLYRFVRSEYTFTVFWVR